MFTQKSFVLLKKITPSLKQTVGRVFIYKIGLLTNSNIFVINEGICNLIITTFIDNLNIFALQRSRIIL